ncbi:MAG: lysophospholipid acyltransferase family protein [Muribaculaceae bacterium]
MSYIFFIYQWFIAIPLLLIATLITALATSIGSFAGGSSWWGYYPAHLWSRLFCKIMFVTIDVVGHENIEPNTSYVFVANHQGAFDIFTIYGYLNHNFRWMMKKSLEKIPFVGYACKRAGHIMVDRSSATAIKMTMTNAKERLQNGMSLVVFPEGARTWNGKMRDFKRGAFKLAVDFNLPIVPLTINGSFNVMPRTTYNIKPGKIILTIHSPIMPPTDGHNTEIVMRESFKAIQQSLPSIYRND